MPKGIKSKTHLKEGRESSKRVCSLPKKKKKDGPRGRFFSVQKKGKAGEPFSRSEGRECKGGGKGLSEVYVGERGEVQRPGKPEKGRGVVK